MPQNANSHAKHYTHTPGKTSLEKELIESLSRFITFRWIMAGGIGTTVLFVTFALSITLPLQSILITTLCILIFNFFCTSYQKHVKSYETFANLQISADWLALVFLAHYTGGIESPVICYFIFHVIISAILLSKKKCYLQTTFALLLILILSMLEYFHIIPHVQVKELFPTPSYDKSLYLVAVLFFCVTSFYISAYLATSVNNRLRKRENEVVALKDSVTEAYNRLEALDREKSEFTFKVTHELRSPLSAIQSLLKSIEEGYAGEIPQKARNLILRSEKRTGLLIALVNDLLDLVSGKIGTIREGEIKHININEAINNSIQLLQEKAKAKEIKIAFESMQKPVFIRVIPEDLDLILTNLIDNAIKYSKKASSILIRSVVTEKTVTMEISDIGIGIGEEDIKRIFEEFYRADNAKEFELEGTGLGLSIVKNLMNRYKGSITVQSKLGEKTTFFVSFPV
ncbi:MAG: HAMP domain-containing histidine kinase [Candidatus Scalindua sp.]|nr:HAMP domain-containing histidine kinase [Candidatus Scalindua sp.]